MARKFFNHLFTSLPSRISLPSLTRLFFAAVLCLCVSALCVFASPALGANDSSEAFMSAEFGLSAARTQKRMENSGAVETASVSLGRLTMKGAFEYRPAIFVFGFNEKKRLNFKAVYIASSGSADEDKVFYEALRAAYNASFGTTDERMVPNKTAKGRIALQNAWKPEPGTTISLFYNPEISIRFPSDSPDDRPIHLTYLKN